MVHGPVHVSGPLKIGLQLQEAGFFKDELPIECDLEFYFGGCELICVDG